MGNPGRRWKRIAAKVALPDALNLLEFEATVARREPYHPNHPAVSPMANRVLMNAQDACGLGDRQQLRVVFNRTRNGLKLRHPIILPRGLCS
jgi:hypothetical protein